MRYCTLLVLLGLFGCAEEGGYSYEKAGASAGTYDMEANQCRERALSAPIRESERERGIAIFDACMRGKGWVLVPR